MTLEEEKQREEIHIGLLEAEKLGWVERVGTDENGEIEWTLTKAGKNYVENILNPREGAS